MSDIYYMIVPSIQTKFKHKKALERYLEDKKVEIKNVEIIKGRSIKESISEIKKFKISPVPRMG